MNKFLKILVFLAFTIPHCALASSDKKVEISVKDKSNNIYELQTTYFLQHGLAKFSYYLVPISKKSQEILLFEGQTFSDGESCPSSKDIIMERAITHRKYIVKDINNDGYDDIILYFTELNCKTKEYTYYKKFLLAEKSGFTLKEIVTRKIQ